MLRIVALSLIATPAFAHQDACRIAAHHMAQEMALIELVTRTVIAQDPLSEASATFDCHGYLHDAVGSDAVGIIHHARQNNIAGCTGIRIVHR